MKRFITTIIVVGIISSLLAACTEDEPNTEATDETVAEEDNSAVQDNANGSGLNAEEILLQSTEAITELNSYSAEMEMTVTMRENGEEHTTASFVTSDIILNPFSFSQRITDSDGELTSEQYMDENGTTYIFEPVEGQWIKIGDIGANLNPEISPQEQLETILTLSDKLTIEEDDTHYLLTIDGSGEELLNITMQLSQIEQSIPTDFLEQIDITTFHYITQINKETYLQEGMDMTLEMELTMDYGDETETFTHFQETKTTFFGFNEMEEIDTPEDALDNAVELDGLDGIFEESEEMDSEIEQ